MLKPFDVNAKISLSFGSRQVNSFSRWDMTSLPRKFKNKVFLPLERLPAWSVELHLYEAACYEPPVVRLWTFSGLELVVRVYLSRMTRINFIVSWSFPPPSTTVIRTLGI